jgi:hypothetical protein
VTWFDRSALSITSNLDPSQAPPLSSWTIDSPAWRESWEVMSSSMESGGTASSAMQDLFGVATDHPPPYDPDQRPGYAYSGDWKYVAVFDASGAIIPGTLARVSLADPMFDMAVMAAIAVTGANIAAAASLASGGAEITSGGMDVGDFESFDFADFGGADVGTLPDYQYTLPDFTADIPTVDYGDFGTVSTGLPDLETLPDYQYSIPDWSAPIPDLPPISTSEASSVFGSLTNLAKAALPLVSTWLKNGAQNPRLGTQPITLPSGQTAQPRPDGTLLANGRVTPMPVGQPFVFADGSVVMNNGDGTYTTIRPDGSRVTTPYPRAGLSSLTQGNTPLILGVAAVAALVFLMPRRR